MSRIYKASKVTIDSDNRVLIKSEKIKFNVKTEEKNVIEEEEKEDKKEESKQEIQAQIKKMLEDAEKEREKILEESREEKKRVLEEARQEGYDAGYENGCKEGKEKGYEDSRKEAEELIKEASEELRKSKEERKETIESIEKEMLYLIMEINNDMLKTTIKYDEKIVLEILKEGLGNTTILDEVIVKVNDKDYDLIKEYEEQLKAIVGSDKKFTLVKDKGIIKNEALIETELGYVKCSLEDKMKTLRANVDLLLNNKVK